MTQQPLPVIPRPHTDPLLAKLMELEGSDMYITVGVPASVRISDRIIALSESPMQDEDLENILSEVLTDEQRQEFEATMEFNLPLTWEDNSRFRINIFRQQQHVGMVIRRIQKDIPTLEQLKLPKVYGELSMENRGLILIVGPTGSGKSSSMAAMVGHRNQHGYGHIVTIEDPIEFVHQHGNCIITQRDVGVDTFSFSMALKNTLRQRPDVVLIGEIRDKETLEHAIHFSETGHLCVSTLHAGNVTQALERIVNFFPAEKYTQLLYNLSQNIKAIIGQRLVQTVDNKRHVVHEIMLNRGLIRTLIQEGKFKEIHELMAKNINEGMMTFDQSLFHLFEQKVITEEVAVAESDNPANLRLQIRQAHPGRASHMFALRPQGNSEF